MKIGWGKAVPIPPQPIYVHPSQSHIIRPPKQSGLPLNCQMPYKLRKTNEPFDGVGVKSVQDLKISLHLVPQHFFFLFLVLSFFYAYVFFPNAKK